MNYYLVHTTYLTLFVAVLARQLCLPVPANLFLLSGGALAGSGRLGVAWIFFGGRPGLCIGGSDLV